MLYKNVFIFLLLLFGANLVMADDDSMHGWGFGMGLGWLIPLLLIVVLVYYINSNKKGGLSAKEILDKRYANGEIDEQEYKKKREILEDKVGGGS